jgi:hypothetical protein
LVAVGGLSPYYWNWFGGDIPSGMQFNGGQFGSVSGTPVQDATYFFSVAVHDSGEPMLVDTVYSMRLKVLVWEDTTFVCGDLDGGGSVTLVDVVVLLAYIFVSGNAPDPIWAADVDCNGRINVRDAVYLVYYLYGNGPAPCHLCSGQ